VAGLVKSELLEATIPAKVYSYIASGKPIVLAMEGEVKDLIENKIKCGYVGPPENHVEFARNIKRIYEKDQEQLELLGDNAKNYHSKYLERNKTLKLLFDFIFKIS
jgi:glycosyltransferase involved in cell wall biosynthesis